MPRPPIVERDVSAFLADAVRASAQGQCDLTGTASATLEVDHSVEIDTIEKAAQHAFRDSTRKIYRRASRLLTLLANSRSNLRGISPKVHTNKSSLFKRVRLKLPGALRSGTPITTVAAVNVAFESGLDPMALSMIAADHRGFADAVDSAATDELAPGLHIVADVLRALVADDFSSLWSRSRASLQVKTRD
jgi:hypothetical protein